MDRSCYDLKKSQLGFIDFLAAPLWYSFTGFLGESLQAQMDQIITNRSHWDDKKISYQILL